MVQVKVRLCSAPSNCSNFNTVNWYAEKKVHDFFDWSSGYICIENHVSFFFLIDVIHTPKNAQVFALHKWGGTESWFFPENCLFCLKKSAASNPVIFQNHGILMEKENLIFFSKTPKLEILMGHLQNLIVFNFPSRMTYYNRDQTKKK